MAPTKKTTASEQVEDQVDEQGDPSAEEAEETEEVENPEEVLKLNHKYRRENENLRKRLKETEDELTAFKEQNMDEQEKAIARARREGEEEAEKKYQSRLLEASVLAAAKGVLQDPEDALRMIDFSGIDPEDTRAIGKEIEALIEAKPYLGVQRRPVEDIDQGPQGPGVGGQTASDWMRSVVGGRR